MTHMNYFQNNSYHYSEPWARQMGEAVAEKRRGRRRRRQKTCRFRISGGSSRSHEIGWKSVEAKANIHRHPVLSLLVLTLPTLTIMTAAAAEQIRSVEAADEILRHDNQVVTAGIPAIRKANMIDMRKTIWDPRTITNERTDTPASRASLIDHTQAHSVIAKWTLAKSFRLTRLRIFMLKSLSILCILKTPECLIYWNFQNEHLLKRVGPLPYEFYCKNPLTS